MMTAPVPPLVTLNEAQSFLRIESGEEEATIAGLIRSASTLCEQFVGRMLIARDFVEYAPATGDWQQLRAAPVQAISDVSAWDVSGTRLPLEAAEYGVDIDGEGRGWVRCCGAPGRSQVQVRGSAGMAADMNGVPEPLRQGVLRLVAHLFADRDGSGGEPPAAVTALWRPYRRVRLAA